MIIGISGSSRNKGTHQMVRTILKASEKPYVFVSLKDKKINSCANCRGCHKTFRCVQKDDMQAIHKKLEKADFIVLGSPTYFDNVSGMMKNFMDRCLPFYFSRKLEGKRVVLLSLANFGEMVEYDKEGKCKWHKEERETASRCINAMANFSRLLGMKVIGQAYGLHEDPKTAEKKLIALGEKLKNYG